MSQPATASTTASTTASATASATLSATLSAAASTALSAAGQARRHDVDRLDSLRAAYRLLGRYLRARSTPGLPADEQAAWFGTGMQVGAWLMRLGVDTQVDAMHAITPWLIPAPSKANP